MRVAARIFLRSAWAFPSMTVLCAAFSGGWLQPNVVWSEAVLIKNRPAGPSVYLGSVTSNQFPPSQRVECAPENTACAAQNKNPGPVPDAVRSSFATELRAQGAIVVMEKPSHDIFDEVSVSLIIRDLPAIPPIVAKSFACDVYGMITRYETGGKRRKKGLELHDAKTDKSASALVTTCLKPAAKLARDGIKAMNQPQNPNNK